MDKYCYLFSGDYLMFSNTQDISSLSLNIQSCDLVFYNFLGNTTLLVQQYRHDFVHYGHYKECAQCFNSNSCQAPYISQWL